MVRPAIAAEAARPAGESSNPRHAVVVATTRALAAGTEFPAKGAEILIYKRRGR
jgi:hypothetical protein